MRPKYLILLLSMTAVLLMSSVSCSKDSRCGKKLEGSEWQMNDEYSNLWIDEVLFEDTLESDLEIKRQYWWSGQGGVFREYRTQTVPTVIDENEDYQFWISDKCSVFSWDDPNYSDRIEANIQELSGIQLIYDYEIEMDGKMWRYEISMTKQ